MIKLKSLINEGVKFIENDEIMVMDSPKGEWKALIFTTKAGGRTYYDWQVGSPPDHYETWEVGGKPHKMAVGGSVQMGKPSENLEQVQADLAEYLKKKGLQYTQVTKIKPRDLNSPEHKDFIDKLGKVAAAFNQEKHEPKPFGKGPPEYGQWISGDDVRSGRVKWVIENYGDFAVVIKWNMSPRQVIKASEFLKNYDHMMQGREASGDYAREVYVRKEPFEGV